MEWQTIDTAPKDCDIVVYYDSAADAFYAEYGKSTLTDYAAWAEGGDFMDGKGVCIAKWFPQHWESTNKYGDGYWLPAWWFSKQNDDYERVVNPTHWIPIPAPPVQP